MRESHSYLQMSPQFEALRIPAKSPEGLWTVLVFENLAISDREEDGF